MYRAGMYTNSEYLEARFGPTARVLSSLVQVQYRTMVLANISTTLFLTFAVVGGLGDGAWWLVGLVVALATAYTISGGSRSVALADVLLSVVMIAASLILFWVVWTAVGGWNGIESRLTEHDPTLATRMLHVNSDYLETTDTSKLSDDEIMRQLLIGGDYDAGRRVITRTTPAWLACLSFVLVGMAYSIVNHEQSMRLFGARSAWDMKMSVVAGRPVDDRHHVLQPDDGHHGPRTLSDQGVVAGRGIVATNRRRDLSDPGQRTHGGRLQGHRHRRICWRRPSRRTPALARRCRPY